MQTKSVALAALVALASHAVAQPQRPRIYYPRNVRRQFENTTVTITSAETVSSPESTLSSTSESSSSSLTERQTSFTDFITSIFSSSSLSSADEVSESSTSQGPVLIETSSPDTVAAPTSDPPTTEPAGTGNIPVPTLQPTTSFDEPDEPERTSTAPSSTDEVSEEPVESTSDTPIIIGPTGTLPSLTTTSTSTSQATSVSEAPLSSEPPSSSAVVSSPAISEIESEAPVSSVPPSPSSTGTPDPVETSSVVRPDPETTSSATPLETTSAPQSQTEAPAPTTTRPAVTTDITDPIETFISDIQPDPETTTNITSPVETTSADEDTLPTISLPISIPVETSVASEPPSLPVTSTVPEVSSEPPSAPTTAPAPTTTLVGTGGSSVIVVPPSSSSSVIDTPISEPSTDSSSETPVVPTVTSPVSQSPPTTTTSEAPGSSAVTDTPITEPGSSVTSEPPAGPTSVPSDSVSSPVTTPVTSDPVTSPVTTPATSLPTPPSSVPVSDGSSNTTVVDPPTTVPSSVPTSLPVDIPTTNVTTPAEVTSTPPTSVDLPATTTISSDAPDETPVSSESEIPPPSSVETVPSVPVTSIRPIATLTNTDEWLPTTIVADPTTFSYSAPTQIATATTSAGIPSNVPADIRPTGTAIPEPPAGSVPIQIGFFYPLNYMFVVENPTAAAQIFRYLPQALADAGNFDISRVQISRLVPYDTRERWGYWTCIAKLHYPETLVDSLQMDLWAPNSALYTNELPIVHNLTAIINPRIDLFGNDEDSLGSGDDSGGDAAPPNNDPFDSGDTGNQSSSQQATTAGIAVGAFGLSVMYGAAMFIVARRYKRKRQAHMRSSSMGSSDMSEAQYGYNGSPALMGGALMSQEFTANYGGVAGGRDSHGSNRSGMGNSVRTANISAPVAAENSLGWN
ncbi:hypothetical protein S40285_05486 [Stachybotrys chlorohalonatus IBT 40285]|uniref:Mid2 domain-containing protein n=1 Tax=Stachybotrys chlorohalonatus (strain IBT 40285) TaxID=1283841 RepID=A0A084QJ71_STAC4|nr:hypothetical protein S40285_05486 [Stachybotrys chlorohalonata IBT 40285]